MTFSIVARDESSGQLGVAVQSHWFSVGSVVTWARAGVGAVATQSNSEISYGPLGLELMSSGKSSAEALQSLLKSDEGRDTRQVAMVDRRGNVAVHTGSKCGPYAGHIADKNFSCQANLMRNERVWLAMAENFERSRGSKKKSSSDFAERLVESLSAGQRAGGDIRGRQSAAILIVSPELSGNYWGGKVVELRVEDHPNPIPELRRLLRLHRGYEWADRGDKFLAKGRFDLSSRAYEKALSYAPEIEELRFWRAVSLAQNGKLAEAKPIFRSIFSKNKDWLKLARMLESMKKISEKDRREILSL